VPLMEVRSIAWGLVPVGPSNILKLTKRGKFPTPLVARTLALLFRNHPYW
jgi:hypothetical protein